MLGHGAEGGNASNKGTELIVWVWMVQEGAGHLSPERKAEGTGGVAQGFAHVGVAAASPEVIACVQKDR